MKLIHSNYEILEQGKGLDGINEQIELAGRTCYKSEPKYDYYNTRDSDGLLVKIKIDPLFDGESTVKHAEEEFLKGNKAYTRKSSTAKDFVDRMIKSGHGAMLEHGTVYLNIPLSITHYNNNKYSVVTTVCSDLNGINRYVTTNYRNIVENGWLDDLKYICEPTEYHEKE